MYARNARMTRNAKTAAWGRGRGRGQIENAWIGEAVIVAALKNAQAERFCAEYMIDRNGTAAAIRAGYSEKSAASTASRLLRRDDVQARVMELQAEQCRRLGVNADRLVIEAMEIYARCMAREPVMEWDAEAKAYVESGEWKFDSRGAAKALELIGRLTGAFTQKVQVTTDRELARFADVLDQLGMNDDAG